MTKESNKNTKPAAKKAAPKKPVAKSTTKVVKKPVPKKEEAKIIQTENNYGRTILAAILIIIILIGGYIGVRSKKKDGGLFYVATADEKKFKNDYEKLNSTEQNREIKVSLDNNVKYISMNDANKILDSESGVIYFGFAGSPWSRNAVPVLIEAVQKNKLETLYYVDIRPESKKENDVRDEFTLDAKNKAKKTKTAEQSYYDVLLALANHLDDYVLTTETGKTVNTGEKRLYAPTVVAVKDGVVVAYHQGTFEGHDTDENGKLADLTKEQEKELLEEYNKLISKFLDDNCKDENC